MKSTPLNDKQPSSTPTVDKFISYIKATVATVGQNIASDDDWVPVLFMSSLSGFNIVALAGGGANTELSKEIRAMMTIPRLIKDAKAQMAAYLGTAFITRMDKEVRYKEECVVVHIVSPSREVSMFGFIEREAHKAPRIARWEVTEGNETLSFGGRYAEGLRLGIRGSING